MRLYNSTYLTKCDKDELLRKLGMVQVSDELSVEEKLKNIELLTVAINGGVSHKKEDILNDILAGVSESDKIGGY